MMRITRKQYERARKTLAGAKEAQEIVRRWEEAESGTDMEVLSIEKDNSVRCRRKEKQDGSAIR